MRLTAQTVRDLALPEGVKERTIFDEDIPRFGIRLRAGGSARWIVQYAVGRKEKRIVLGPVKVLDAGKARSQAQTLLARIRLGEDPLAAKHEAAARAEETFGAQLPRYLAHKRASLRTTSYTGVVRHLNVYAKPLHIRQLSVLATDRRGIALLLAGLAQSSGAPTANLVRASLSGFCTWLVREGLLEANPVIATNRAAQVMTRERTLSELEIYLIWNALDDDRYGAVVKLLMLTGLRREEIGGLRWDEVDLEGRIIKLPASRCKSRHPHEVQLSPAALEILEAQPRTGDWVFGPFNTWSHGKRKLDLKLGDSVTAFRLHDIRRTVSTMLHDRVGVAPHIVEAILGHHGGHRSGPAGVYNKARYAIATRDALDRWAALLMDIVSGRQSTAKVLQLR
jgi:integrase